MAKQSMGRAVIGNIIYIIGGRTSGGVTGVVEAYNTATNKWLTPLPSLNTARSDCSGY